MPTRHVPTTEVLTQNTGDNAIGPVSSMRNPLSVRPHELSLATTVLLFLATFSGHVGIAKAQCTNCSGVQYEFESGIPSAPCWSLFATGSGASFLDPDGLVIATAAGGYVFESARPPFAWSDGWTMEARLRVPIGSMTQFPGLRSPGFGGADASGIVVYAWIWSDGLALSTDQNAQSPGLAIAAFNSANAFHTYAIETDTNGAKLRVDGTVLLQLPYTSAHPSVRNVVQFGNDSRTSTFAVTKWQFVSFFGTRGSGDMNCDGTLSVSDIGGFVLALTDPVLYASTYPDCDVLSADLNCDGLVSVGDIALFVSLLTGS